MSTCKHVGASGKRCANTVLMNDYCIRHLKQKCAICFEEVSSTNSNNSKRLTCGHAFHSKCIFEWFVSSNDCPVCRTEQGKDPLIRFKTKVEENIRAKYRDSILSYEMEISRLRNIT